MTLLPLRMLATLVLLAGVACLSVAPGTARAETYHTCEGFIDSLPATISTQGVWCLRENLGTNINSGNAITIATNNVTIDCNGFKIGGLAAGDGSEARGIYADNRQNATVRHCNVRGFQFGIWLKGGAGHVVEDNRLDNNLVHGIRVSGDNNLVQRNLVYDTGGSTRTGLGIGIAASADVIDNTVAGVFGVFPSTSVQGIYAYGHGNTVRNNRIRGLQASGSGNAIGIWSKGNSMTIDGNQIAAATGGGNGTGIDGTASTVCSNNVVIGFSAAISECVDAGDNTSL